jgi:hypothetical protein
MAKVSDTGGDDDGERVSGAPSSTTAAEVHEQKGPLPKGHQGGHVGDAGGSGRVGLLGKKSPGVMRIEAISAHFRFADRVLVFCGVFLIAYAYGLDGIVRFTYQVSLRPDTAASRRPAFIAVAATWITD